MSGRVATSRKTRSRNLSGMFFGTWRTGASTSFQDPTSEGILGAPAPNRHFWTLLEFATSPPWFLPTFGTWSDMIRNQWKFESVRVFRQFCFAENSKYLRILGSGDSSYSKCMELKIFTISLLSRLFVLCLQGKPPETRNLFDCRRIRILSRNLSARIPELGGACWLARWRAVLQHLGGGGTLYRALPSYGSNKL